MVERIDPYIFKLNNQIDKGASSEVYEERWRNRAVAVKKFKLSAIEQFSKEYKTLVSLRHDRIVKLLGYCDTSYSKYLIFELMKGGTLYDYLSDPRNVITWKTANVFLRDIVKVMSYLHEKNIVHLDLKSTNILLNESHTIAKLADFGLARKLNFFETNENKLKGTIRWMAPEHFKKTSITEKADVWSFGCVLIEFATRRLPFCKLRNDRDVRKMLEDDKYSYTFNYASEPPYYIKHLISACTRRDPKTRPSFKEIDNYLNTIYLSCYDTREIIQVPCEYSLLPTPEITIDEPSNNSTTMRLYPSLTHIETKMRLLINSKDSHENTNSPSKFEFKLLTDKTKDINNNPIESTSDNSSKLSSKLIILNGDSDEEDSSSNTNPKSNFNDLFILFGKNKENKKSESIYENANTSEQYESSSEESEPSEQRSEESESEEMPRSFSTDFTPENPTNFEFGKTDASKSDLMIKNTSNLSKISEVSEPSSWENAIYTPESTRDSFVERSFDRFDTSNTFFGYSMPNFFKTNSYISDKRNELRNYDVKKDLNDSGLYPNLSRNQSPVSTPSSSSADEQSPKMDRKWKSTNDSGIQCDLPTTPPPPPVVKLNEWATFYVDGARSPFTAQMIINYLKAPIYGPFSGTKTTMLFSSTGIANGNVIYKGPRGGLFYVNSGNNRGRAIPEQCVDISNILYKLKNI